MQQTQQQILQVLNQNQGNRLTFELINGLAARLQMVVAEHAKRASEAQSDAVSEDSNE